MAVLRTIGRSAARLRRLDIHFYVARPALREGTGVICGKTLPLVIPKPVLLARNLFAGSETADSSRVKAALRNDNCLRVLKLGHDAFECELDARFGY
jgi:hypothetical protein